MKPQLIDNHAVWHKLWSIRLAILSAFFAAIEVSLPLWNDLLPPRVFAGLATLTAIGAGIARVIKQQLDHAADVPAADPGEANVSNSPR